jgi:tRNA threonylcarbamoyladenosine biosynthesis protein TsaB
MAGWSPEQDPLLDEPEWPPQVLSPESLQRVAAQVATQAASQVPARAVPLALGDGAVRFRRQLEAAGVQVPPEDSSRHRVSARSHCRLAALARISAVPVEPEYLRAPDAERTSR